MKKLPYLLVWTFLVSFPFASADGPHPGEEVDLAPFGRSMTSDDHPGIEWDEPRDVRRVELEIREERAIPELGAVALDYWVTSWPPRPSGGWTQTDSPWQGQWREANVSREVAGKILVLRFAPLTETENPNARNAPGFAPTFRRTLKLRVRSSGDSASISALRIFGNSRWAAREINVQSGCEGKERLEISASAYNGGVISSAPMPSNAPGVRLTVLYTDHEPSSNDRTILMLRAGSHSFGVSVDDVIQRKAIYIRPFGVFVGDSISGQTFESWIQSGALRSGEDVISRISKHEEQTLARAMSEIPALAFAARSSRHPFRYIPLGFPASREKYGLDFNGNAFINKHSVKAMKEDLARMLWKGEEIYFRLGTGALPDFREREHGTRQSLLEGDLPFVTTRWQQEGVEYEEQAYATMLSSPLDEARLRGDEPSLLHIRLSAHNPGSNPERAVVWFDVSPQEKRELRGGLLLGTGDDDGAYPKTRLRAALEAPEGRLELRDLPPASAYQGRAVLWTAIVPARDARVLYIKIPFRTMQAASEIEEVRRAKFTTRLEETVAYWRKQIARGMQINVPEPEFNRFFRAALQHILVSIQRDVASGLDMCPCGTYDYNMFANETHMQARLLDMRGLYDEAWRCMRPVVELQGSKPFPGLFRDKSAIFHGVRLDAEHDYTHSGYNLNHGWTLWRMAEHYLFTRDRGWLQSVLPRMLKGANWIIEERKATMRRATDGSPVPEYGLLPPGQLEDNEEWHYWFAVNAYAYRGLNAAADAVSAIDPAEGARLKREAAAYREDIRNAVLRAMAIAPAAALRDGTFVPLIPPRASLHGRDFGWIRNILYGPHALVDCGVFGVDEPLTAWALQDLEDNLFMAEDSLSVPDRDWFSRGGVALQPNLVNTFVTSLERDQIPQALRAFFNTFAISYYPDVAAFTEWVPTLGTGGGPFFKTSDEAGFLAWLRLLLVRESENKLFLNSGAPRQWFLPGRVIEIERAATFFGEMSFRVESHPEIGFIQASVSLPTRERPREAFLRLRHPERKPMLRVELNGRAWKDFNAEKEWISLPPGEGEITLRAFYQ